VYCVCTVCVYCVCVLCVLCVCTVCVYCVCTVCVLCVLCVLCVYCVCTVCVLCVYCVCTVCVLCVYCVCTVCTVCTVYAHVVGCELYWFAGELRVKVLKVLFGCHIGLVRWNDLLGVEQRPVDGLEERMRLDVREASLSVTAETLLRVLTTAQH